jgi:hypothetical protein
VESPVGLPVTACGKVDMGLPLSRPILLYRYFFKAKFILHPSHCFLVVDPIAVPFRLKVLSFFLFLRFLKLARSKLATRQESRHRRRRTWGHIHGARFSQTRFRRAHLRAPVRVQSDWRCGSLIYASPRHSAFLRHEPRQCRILHTNLLQEQIRGCPRPTTVQHRS